MVVTITNVIHRAFRGICVDGGPGSSLWHKIDDAVDHQAPTVLTRREIEVATAWLQESLRVAAKMHAEAESVADARAVAMEYRQLSTLAEMFGVAPIPLQPRNPGTGGGKRFARLAAI